MTLNPLKTSDQPTHSILTPPALEAGQLYKLSTYTHLGALYKRGYYKTKRALRAAHTRMDNAYGAYLRAVVEIISS